MTQRLCDLPIGAKVKDINTAYYGRPIEWKIIGKNHPGYPKNSVTLLSDKILCLKAIDAKESGGDSNRQKYGNNRYMYSNMRQWLNSDKEDWYEPQHEYDNPPSSEYLYQNYNPYDKEAGFLTNFSSEFKTHILPTTLDTSIPIVDGIGFDRVVDKVFILSNTEIGAEGEDVLEGASFLELSGSDGKKAYPTPEAVANSNYKPTGLVIDEPWGWWLRTRFTNNAYTLWGASSSGYSFYGDVYKGVRGVRPALNLPQEALVSDEPDVDGCYKIYFTTITGTDENLGGLENPPTKEYIISNENFTSLPVTIKLDGNIIESFNATIGQTYTLNLTDVWNTLSYGTHVVTVECNEAKRAWTFIKLLRSTNDKIKNIVLALQELQTINQKAELRQALINKGVDALESDSVIELINKLNNMELGKKWASGAMLSSSVPLNFRTPTGASRNCWYLEVIGLDFNPSIVIAICENSPEIGIVANINAPKKDDNILIIAIDDAYILEGVAFLDQGGFRIPVHNTNSTTYRGVSFQWVAYE
ncbi:hypothetical protein DW1_1159 [Proteiniborus sp. DW1]|uniref:DUF6273 domain-containing protein n=1 Tax=Proteiniborus sp. DW1 TaxID=1889883 RepID=UPI00092E0C18|nr:DUF6273 domain-containing protein [Proteiniborus sp. DW1]SCG82732.1 hypothetical protein DW1_1159 [Proteiniborus sp. DW1]